MPARQGRGVLGRLRASLGSALAAFYLSVPFSVPSSAPVQVWPGDWINDPQLGVLSLAGWGPLEAPRLRAWLLVWRC